jgi:neutral ceramidase
MTTLMPRSLLIVLLAAFGVLLGQGCGGHQMPASHAPFEPRGRGNAGQLEVGVARVDITPPPGASLFGHGPGARVSVGVWTRLMCRAFYLSTQQAFEPGIALVSCDLPMSSTLLHRRTALRIYPVLPSSHLLLVATHTHAGPGHFFDAKNLNGATSSHFPGYDDAMVEYLAERIADAVMRARANRRPAEMRWVRSQAWGLTRNRSLAAHRLNPRPYPGSEGAPEHLTGSQRAIDPNLRLLEFRALDPGTHEPGGPIGSIAFFAMHPTVLPNTNRHYGADAFGVAVRLVDRELEQQWAHVSSDTGARCYRREIEGNACLLARSGDPVHAIVNTNFGDVTPDRSLGTAVEAVGLGERLASSVWAAHCADGGCPGASSRSASEGRDAPEPKAESWRSRVQLDLRYVEVNLPGARLLAYPPGVREPALCSEAALGLRSIRGAADHPSIMEWLLPGSVNTADYDATDCQAPKVTSFLLRGGFPEQLPLTLARLDNTLVSFVPGEATIQAGEEINASVRAVGSALGLGSNADAVVSGIANGYIQYLATQHEYQLQRYEGSSTLYGPSSVTYLAQVFHHLARHMAGQPVEGKIERLMNSTTGRKVGEAEAFEYSPGPERERLWRGRWDTPLAELRARRTDPGRVRLCRIPRTEPAAICMQWFDGGPGVVGFTDAPWVQLVLDRNREVVRVDSAPLGAQGPTPGRRWKVDPIDDTGFYFFTRVLAPEGDGYRWSTVFRPNRRVADGLPKHEKLRMIARGAAGEQAVVSSPFSVGDSLSLCSPQELREPCAYP